jgi:integrase
VNLTPDPHPHKTGEDIKRFIEVERWLRGLDLAPGTKAKIRNHLSSLFSHCIRHELYSQLNPIASVRQSAVGQRDPDILTVKEMQATIGHIASPTIRLMVLVAATSAIRRSELRGLKWEDIDFDGLQLTLKRGLFRKEETAMKTRASRKPVPILPDLAMELRAWREQSAYPTDADWVFASPSLTASAPTGQSPP